MIATVSIEPSALRVPGEERPQERARAERGLGALAESLFHYGCVVSASAEDATELLAAARALEEASPTVGRRWLDALAALKESRRFLRANPTRTSVSAATDEAELRREWREMIRLAVLRDDHADELGIHDCDNADQPELSPSTLARDAATFRELERLAASQVWPRGDTRESFWEQVLGPLARRSSEIHLCDRYLLKGLAHQDAGVRASRDPDVLQWVLGMLDRGAHKDVAVSLYLGLGETSKVRGRDILGPTTANQAAELVGRYFRPGAGRIARLSVWGVTWRSMRWERRPHDRHIGFSAGADIGLDRGLDSFGTATITPDAGIKWSFVASAAGREKNESERNAIASAGDLAIVA